MFLTRTLSRTAYLVEAMRPRHWVKNVVVLAAPLFALAFEPAVLGNVLWAFVAFSMTASAFYLINDVMDVESDRAHPVKRHRPIAAGYVSVPAASAAACVMLAASIVFSFAVAPLLGVAVGVYATLQVGYNLWLKHRPILDIMVISAGFVIRALGGAAAADVPVSGWFVLCVGLLAFFLGVEKRKAELKALGQEAGTRTVLSHYTLSWLARIEGVVTASALMAYALWTIEGAGTNWMLATLPFVAYAIFKYQYLSEHGEGETPEETLLKNPDMVATIGLWAATVVAILWFSR